jgi:tRNA pseudouridine(38-40) synthase
VRCVQDFLESSMSTLLNSRVTILSASRTDAGVHARELFFRAAVPAEAALALFSSPRDMREKWSAALPDDIRIARLRWARPSQIILRSATHGKTYSFYIRGGPHLASLSCADVSMLVSCPIDAGFTSRIARAVADYVGTHDFSPFAMGRGSASGGASATRTIADASVSFVAATLLDMSPGSSAPPADAGEAIAPAEVGAEERAAPSTGGAGVTTAAARVVGSSTGVKRSRESAVADAVATAGPTRLLRIRVTANGFLRHQMRLMVGAAIAVGSGALPLDFIKDELRRGVPHGQVKGAPRFRAAAARGLHLEKTLLHDAFWTDPDFCNNPAILYKNDHNIRDESWHPRVSAGAGAGADSDDDDIE